MPVDFFGDSGSGNVGGVSATVHMDATPMAADMARVKKMLDDLEVKLGQTGRAAATSTNAIAAGMNGVGNTANAAGYKMQVFAQTFDDLQYVGEQGLRPILNNLVQISPVLGVAAIAADLLYKNLDKITGTGPVVKSATDEMKELGKETRLTADEQARLNVLKGTEAGKGANVGGMSAEEKATLAGVGKAIDEAGYEELKKAIRANMDLGAFEPTEAELRELEHARRKEARHRIAPDPLGIGRAFGAETFVQQAEAKIKKRIEESINAAIDDLLGKARGVTGPEGEGARKALRDLIRAAPREFRGGLPAALEDLTPEGRDRAETARLVAEGAAGAAAYDRKKALERADRDTADALRELDRAKAEEARELDEAAREFAQRDLGAKAGDVVHAEALGRVEEERARLADRAGANAANTRDFFEARDLRKSILESMVTSSQVFSMSELNARVQSSISNADPSLRKQDQMIRELTMLNQKLDKVGKPFTLD